MRAILFLVADRNMEYALRGLFERERWWMTVQCRVVDINPEKDIVVAVGQNDPGLFTRANELLRQYHGEYEHVVVMIDAAWDGSPGPAPIRQRLNEHIVQAGWLSTHGLALVLDPEVDVWLWSDSPHAATAMGWNTWEDLRSALAQAGWLTQGEIKPQYPKEAAAWALREKRKPRSSAVYRQIASKASINRCKDAALEELIHALQRWFPPQDA